MLDWSDLRIFLAVARAGSTLQAARGLGLNQTTVSRRMQALEQALGLVLFVRRTTGYCLTEHGRVLREAAEHIEAGARAFEQEAERLRRLSARVIRVTAAETMFTHLLAPIMLAHRREHPDVQIEQVSSELNLDIEGGEVDVAFRATENPNNETLIARRLPDLPWTLYCSPAYAAEHGMPRCAEEVRDHSVLVFDKGLAQTRWGRWLAAYADPARIAARSNSVTNMVGLVRASLGVGLMPCLEGDNAGLLRCIEPPPELAGRWWILMTPEVHRIAAVRRFADFVAARLRTQRRFLRGQRT
jgi:DNA-binding transcriptional LysR family regulator